MVCRWSADPRRPLATQIQGLATILSSAQATVQAFQALRAHCPDELWEEISISGPFADLLDSLSDLEGWGAIHCCSGQDRVSPVA